MFKRLFTRKDNSLSGGNDSASQVESDNLGGGDPPSVGSNQIAIQTEIPVKTVSTSTADIQRKDNSTATDLFERIDKDVCTERTSTFDAISQTCIAHMDAGVDPGEWNYVIFRGIDTQTDSPDQADPLFWLSGTLSDSMVLIRKLVDTLEREELNSEPSQDEVDILKLRADNVLLRIEVSALKRKIGKLESMTATGVGISAFDARKSQRDTILALTGGNQYASAFVVTSEAGLTVTSNLAPSSAPLGTLKKGDKILLAGAPEEICGQVRGPVLPRGWVTLRDSSNTYLRKAG